MSVYSKRFSVYQALTESASVTVPAGVVWIVRDLDAFAHTASTAALYVEGNDGQILWFAEGAAGAYGLYASWRGRQVLYEGEELTVNPAAGSWDVTICGYELTSS